LIKKVNHFIQQRSNIKEGIEDRIIVLMSDGYHILKKIPVPVLRYENSFE
jgi:hypothetical protein